MKKILLNIAGKKILADYGASPLAFLNELAEDAKVSPREVLALRVNGEICSLAQPLAFNAKLDAVALCEPEGADVYRRSLCFVLAAAAHKVFPKKRLLVGHSLGHGYYYTLESDEPLRENDVCILEDEMRKIIKADMPIEQSRVSFEDAAVIFEKMNLPASRKQLDFGVSPTFRLNSIGGFSDLYTDPLLPSTGYLDVFALRKFEAGFLLCYPPSRSPKKLLPHEKPLKALFSVYSRYKDWGKKLGVTSAADLNELIAAGKCADFIDICESLQNKCFADAADKVREKGGVRVVLMAGPSSSGKTTSSKKLAMQLRVNGFNPKVISIDDYYVDREKTPKNKQGEYDYECLGALRISDLNQDLTDLFCGKEVKIPKYDFAAGTCRYSDDRKIRMEKNDILIMEGIHGLNDALTPLVAPEQKFKIYVSVLGQLNLNDHARISTRDNRLVRRIVRDAWTRGKSASDSIKMWPNVQRGEVKHIFPFQDNADVIINSALDYELSVLKVYAEPLLRCVSPVDEAFPQASRLILFLSNFLPMPAEAVPKQSLLREFIGGSAFKY